MSGKQEQPGGSGRLWRPLVRAARWLGRQFVVGEGGVLGSLIGPVVAATLTLAVQSLRDDPLPSSAAGWWEFAGIAVMVVVSFGGLTWLVRILATRPDLGDGLTVDVEPVQLPDAVGSVVGQRVLVREVVITETVVTETRYVYPATSSEQGE